MAEQSAVKEERKIKKAEVGDEILITGGVEKGKTGKVNVVRDNSVIVERGYNAKKEEPILTGVNHQRYKIKK